MKRIGSVLFIGMVMTLSVSCTKSRVSQKELTSYISDENNGLIKKINSGDVHMSVSYYPADLMCHQQAGRKTTSQEQSLGECPFKNFVYFNISISQSGRDFLAASSSREEMSDRLHLLAFEMNKHVNLRTNGNDTLRLIDYVFPRTYGATPESQVMLVFEKSPKNEVDYILTLDDLSMGLQNSKMTFDHKKISNIPELN